jgi:hypothetical protein
LTFFKGPSLFFFTEKQQDGNKGCSGSIKRGQGLELLVSCGHSAKRNPAFLRYLEEGVNLKELNLTVLVGYAVALRCCLSVLERFESGGALRDVRDFILFSQTFTLHAFLFEHAWWRGLL